MRFEKKYPNLGYMEKKRIPIELHREIESLLTELDRLAAVENPCEILSGFCEGLKAKELPDIEEEEDW